MGLKTNTKFPITTLYIGVTAQLDMRLLQHHAENSNSFTGRHQVNSLVWYEWHDTIEAAITREKQLKRWNRVWKIELIEKDNPSWKDLAREMDLA